MIRYKIFTTLHKSSTFFKKVSTWPYWTTDFFLSLWQITFIIIIFVLIPKFFAHKQLCQQIHCIVIWVSSQNCLAKKKSQQTKWIKLNIELDILRPNGTKNKTTSRKKKCFYSVSCTVHTNIVYQVHTVCLSRRGGNCIRLYRFWLPLIFGCN